MRRDSGGERIAATVARSNIGPAEAGAHVPVPSVRVSEHTDLPPEVVLAAARDFSERRAEMWPDVHVEYLTIHEVGPDYADVTEGNPWPIGYVWERLRYDWSDPQALRGRVIDSNLFKPGSTWELWATPDDRGSHVEIRAVRNLRGRGWLPSARPDRRALSLH